MASRTTRQDPKSDIEWSINAVATAMSLERMLCLCEVFKDDKGLPYTTDPRFAEVRRKWTAKYIELGGDIKSDDVRNPTAILDAIAGHTAHGVNLLNMFPKSNEPAPRPRPAARTKVAAGPELWD